MALSDCGTLVSLVGDDGNRHFYGHLSVWEGGSRRVGAGEVIGYVGATGQTKAPVWGGESIIIPSPTYMPMWLMGE